MFGICIVDLYLPCHQYRMRTTIKKANIPRINLPHDHWCVPKSHLIWWIYISRSSRIVTINVVKYVHIFIGVSVIFEATDTQLLYSYQQNLFSPFQEQDEKSPNMNVHQGRTKQPRIRWRPVLGVWIRAYCCCCSAILYHFHQRSVVYHRPLLLYITFTSCLGEWWEKQPKTDDAFTRTPVKIKMIETKHVKRYSSLKCIVRIFLEYSLDWKICPRTPTKCNIVRDAALSPTYAYV